MLPLFVEHLVDAVDYNRHQQTGVLSFGDDSHFISIRFGFRWNVKKAIMKRKYRGRLENYFNVYYICNYSIAKCRGFWENIVYWLYISNTCVYTWWRTLDVSGYMEILTKVLRNSTQNIIDALGNNRHVTLDIVLHLCTLNREFCSRKIGKMFRNMKWIKLYDMIS